MVECACRCEHLWEAECGPRCRPYVANRRVVRRRRRRQRWTAQRQYGLRCYQRRWVTPQSVVVGYYMNQTGRRISWPCGCPVCVHPETVVTGPAWWHSAAFRAWCVSQDPLRDSEPSEGRTARMEAAGDRTLRDQ